MADLKIIGNCFPAIEFNDNILGDCYIACYRLLTGSVDQFHSSYDLFETLLAISVARRIFTILPSTIDDKETEEAGPLAVRFGFDQ